MMPEMVTREIQAQDVKFNDVFEPMGSNLLVTKRERKTKYVWLYFGEIAKPKRFDPLETVTVARSQPTAEEKAAREAERIAETREDFVTSCREIVTEAQAAVDGAHEYQKQRLDNGWTLLDSSSLDRLMEAYAKHKVAGVVAHQWEMFDKGTYHNHEGECEYGDYDSAIGGRRCQVARVEMTEYEYALRILDLLFKQTVNGALNVRVLSRSSSATSNLCEDLETEARAWAVKKLINGWRSYSLPELQSYRGLNIY